MAGSPGVPTPQPPFQVGAVKAKKTVSSEKTASRRFLCYNALGSVTTTRESGSDFNVVDMAFHDTGRRGRVPTITDYHGYDIAVLGERGCALASPGSKEGGAATVFYRPYESWAHAPEWRVALPKGERAVSVAAGDAFVAVVTSERLLRVFTHAGAQKHIVQLEGAPVTCAAKGDSLVVVWHAGAPQTSARVGPGSRSSAASETEQRLAYAEHDVGDDGAVVSRGALPLAPGSTLTWLGFVETGAGAAGAIAYASSDGVVRVRTPSFGGSFAPVFRSADARAQEGEHHWPVAVSVADDVNGACAGLYAVVCRDADGPAVHPKPVLTPMPLSHPVALPEGSAGELEDVASRARLAAVLAAAAAEEERARAGDVSGASADALARARRGDKASLRLFHAACKAERPARAADVAAMLHLSSSMHGALKRRTRCSRARSRSGSRRSSRRPWRRRRRAAAARGPRTTSTPRSWRRPVRIAARTTPRRRPPRASVPPTTTPTRSRAESPPPRRSARPPRRTTSPRRLATLTRRRRPAS